MITNSIQINVYNCARCGKDHIVENGVVFYQFTKPIEDSGGTIWEWWGLCPEMDEPVLMKMFHKPDVVSSSDDIQ